MNNYCGFIEVWNEGKITGQDFLPLRISSLESLLQFTIDNGYKTIAIFKIKLK